MTGASPTLDEIQPPINGRQGRGETFDPAAQLARLGGQREIAGASQAEDQRERLVDGAQLAGVEAPRGSTEALRVDHGRLLDENVGLVPFQDNDWAEARRSPCTMFAPAFLGNTPLGEDRVREQRQPGVSSSGWG